MGHAIKTRRGGSSGKLPSPPTPRPPAEKYSFHKVYSADGTFTVPSSGWYRIFAIGKSGDGSYNGDPPYGGGGSGGIATSELYLTVGTVIAVTVTDALTSFGFYCSATAGIGRTGGEAYGGNVANEHGHKGGTIGVSGKPANKGRSGDNGGAAGGNPGSVSGNYSAGGGGGGGARLPSMVCPYVSPPFTSLYKAGNGGNNYDHSSSKDGSPADRYPDPVWTSDLMLFGGGSSTGRYGLESYHAQGSPGALVIEKGGN